MSTESSSLSSTRRLVGGQPWWEGSSQNGMGSRFSASESMMMSMIGSLPIDTRFEHREGVLYGEGGFTSVDEEFAHGV